MQVTTIEGIVKNGQIQVGDDVVLPEMAKVYVIIPRDDGVRSVRSPRLVNKADARDFEKTVEDDVDDEI